MTAQTNGAVGGTPLRRCCRDLAIEWLIIRGHLRRVLRALPG